MSSTNTAPFDQINFGDFLRELKNNIYEYDETLDISNKEARDLISEITKQVLKKKEYNILGVEVFVQWKFEFLNGFITKENIPEITLKERNFTDFEIWQLRMHLNYSDTEFEADKLFEWVKIYCNSWLEMLGFPHGYDAYYFKGQKGDIATNDKFIGDLNFHKLNIPLEIINREYSFLSASSLHYYFPHSHKLKSICEVLKNIEMLSVINLEEEKKRIFWFKLGVTLFNMQNACITLKGDNLTLHERAEKGLTIVKAQTTKANSYDIKRLENESIVLELAKDFFKTVKEKEYTKKYQLTEYVYDNWNRLNHGKIRIQEIEKMIRKFENADLIPKKINITNKKAD